jgi:hypothetical protein
MLTENLPKQTDTDFELRFFEYSGGSETTFHSFNSNWLRGRSGNRGHLKQRRQAEQ